MSTVAAVGRAGRVWMAADSMTNVYDRPVYTARKVRRVRAGLGEMLIGFTGDGALGDLVSTGLRVDGEPSDVDSQEWAAAVAYAITDLATQHGIVEDGRLAGHLLLGWSGQIWTIAHGIAIRHDDGVAAVGSGEGPAIGALDVLLGRGADPAAALVEAVETAIARDKHSGGRVELLCLEPSATAAA